ncbi:unnamed protein product, partial [Amoebophrya sp. A25]|eukprot:GSA25T00023242001.1
MSSPLSSERDAWSSRLLIDTEVDDQQHYEDSSSWALSSSTSAEEKNKTTTTSTTRTTRARTHLLSTSSNTRRSNRTKKNDVSTSTSTMGTSIPPIPQLAPIVAKDNDTSTCFRKINDDLDAMMKDLRLLN